MLGDTERSSAYAAEQRRLVRAAVAAEVLTYTPFWREAAAEAGLKRPSSIKDLARLPPRPLNALGTPNALVLRPPPEAVRKSGPKPLRRQLRRARLGRSRAGAMRRILDPLYKPIHWIIEGDVPVGCTEADLVRLAELGRRSLTLAGVGETDAIVGLVPPGPTLSSWQLVLGAREGAIPLAALVPAASIEAVGLLGPTVLAGRPQDLLRVIEGLTGSARRAVGTVLTITRAPLLPNERAALEAAAGRDAVVVEQWAPPGTRALWTQCRGGQGVHTWPQAELVEVCGPDGTAVEAGAVGELVWTGLGWRGTTLVRLATGVSGRLVDGACETCGRTTPRILDARVVNGTARSANGSGRHAERGAVLGEVKETGTYESVRTVRAPRSTSAPPTRRPAERAGANGSPPAEAGPVPEPTPEDEGVVVRPLDEPVDDAEIARAAFEAAREEEAAAEAAAEAEGLVRAVPRDRPEELPDAPPLVGAVDRGDVDLDHLPPVPEVGPDASGDREGEREDAWLPDTGEVDAWPAPVLASTEGLAAWQVEHRRRRGRDELVVHLALAEGGELAEVLVALERAIGATQYVVAAEADVEARVAAAGGRRVVDRRATGNGKARQAQGAAPGPTVSPWEG